MLGNIVMVQILLEEYIMDCFAYRWAGKSRTEIVSLCIYLLHFTKLLDNCLIGFTDLNVEVKVQDKPEGAAHVAIALF